MKKIKALIAMVALVAVIAVASVAQAQVSDTLQVTASVNTSNVSINLCTVALTPTITPAAEGTGSCAATYSSNDLDGFLIDMQGDTATMTATSPTGTIAAFNWVVTTDETCDIGEDCFAFLFNGTVFSADTDEGVDTFTADPGANTDDYDTGDHAIPTGGYQNLVGSTDTSVVAGDYSLDYTANVDNSVVANSSYVHDGDIQITAQ